VKLEIHSFPVYGRPRSERPKEFLEGIFPNLVGVFDLSVPENIILLMKFRIACIFHPLISKA
jgi:hypothetical protein